MTASLHVGDPTFRDQVRRFHRAAFAALLEAEDWFATRRRPRPPEVERARRDVEHWNRLAVLECLEPTGWVL